MSRNAPHPCCALQRTRSWDVLPRTHALALWLRGYPDQAVASSQAALALTQQLAHPLSLVLALIWAATYITCAGRHH